MSTTSKEELLNLSNFIFLPQNLGMEIILKYLDYYDTCIFPNVEHFISFLLILVNVQNLYVIEYIS